MIRCLCVRDSCEFLEGHLATMNLAEQKQLLKFVKKEWPREIDFWVGGTRIGTGPWKWVTEETIPDAPDLIWYGGEQEPGNKYSYHNCLALHVKTGAKILWNPSWNGHLDHSISHFHKKANGLHRHNGYKEYPYICELENDIL